MSSTQPSWDSVLGLMEQRLELAERWLDGDGVGINPGHFALPAGMGPMPPSLTARAARVLEATALVQARLQAEMATIESRLRLAGPAARARPEGRPAPSYVDRSA